jgi:hypothetical protein
MKTFEVNGDLTDEIIERLQGSVDSIYGLKECLQIEGCFVAGGFIRDSLTGSDFKDIDLFFENEDALAKVLSFFLQDKNEGNVTSFKYFGTDYQLVHKDFPSLEERVRGFDFNCISAAFDGRRLVFTDSFYSDCVDKKVTVNTISKPLNSLNRLASYAYKYWDVLPAYRYILELMLDKNERICLLGDYYEDK